MQPQLTEPELLEEISRRWKMSAIRLRPDLPLSGSPERTTWRSVVETDTGRLFVLEKIHSKHFGRKRQIIDILQRLSHLGLAKIVPYLPDAGGDSIPLFHHGLWQLCPFVAGVDLDRPTYAMDGWRGDAAAAFLIQLKKICSQYPLPPDTSSFSIVQYIRELFSTLTRNEQVVAHRFHPALEYLERHFFPRHDRLPTGFCHGDYHPINIIWGEASIKTVIDWEFCGIKPEIYDLANLVGCLGMEDPDSLAGPFVRRLVCRLKRSGIYSRASWNALPDLMVAIRFAWLNEWMRKKDHPMIQLEAGYMALLLEHRQDLKALINCC